MTPERVMFCSLFLPQSNLDSYSRRLLHLVEFLADSGCSVTCVAQKRDGADQATPELEALGVRVFFGLESRVRNLAKAERFDLAILGFWHVAKRVMSIWRECSPATRLIVDSGDLHFLRNARRILLDANLEEANGVFSPQYAQEMLNELTAYAAADAVFAVSRKEAEFVGDFIGDPTRAFTVPDCEDLSPSAVPFAKRRGMFFVGNFQHPPNIEAVEFLCKQVLTQLDPDLLARHPVYIAGNAMTPAVAELARGLPNVRMLGWIPSVVPYLERVRVSLVPLLHGAGTKRKLIQALVVGAPTVSTTIGVEGLDLRDGEEVLVADDPVAFANATVRLLENERLWKRLVQQGRERVLRHHARDAVRERFAGALKAVMTKPGALEARRGASKRVGPADAKRKYRSLVTRIREMVPKTLPRGSKIAVVSKGDDDLLALEHCDAWHYPQTSTGVYAGQYPAGDQEAIAQLETLRTKGADFLLFPTTAFWWLDHYSGLKRHLEAVGQLVVDDPSSCRIFALSKTPNLDLPAPGAGGVAPADASAAASIRRKSPALPLDALTHAAPESRVVVSTRSGSGNRHRISVVIPTHNRAALLEASLASLSTQSIPTSDFEVIVVCDGCTDTSEKTCEAWSSKLPLECVAIERSGIAVAKNVGVAAATAPVVLFFDDDDIADSRLLAGHLETHEKYPLENVAVLGFTGWAPTLRVSELMRFVTDVGHYLFNYSRLQDGQRLDFTYFWGGRTSCKRSLLTRFGLFRDEFEFGSEDIELGFRISKQLVERALMRVLRQKYEGDEDGPHADPRLSTAGLAVIYNSGATQFMNREITYDDFCRRCEKQGRSQWQFSCLYDDELVHDWCQIGSAAGRWEQARNGLAEKRARVREIEAAIEAPNNAPNPELIKELHGLYWWTFDAFKAKGIIEASQASAVAAVPEDATAGAVA